jgi:hypothetical protein
VAHESEGASEFYKPLKDEYALSFDSLALLKKVHTKIIYLMFEEEVWLGVGSDVGWAHCRQQIKSLEVVITVIKNSQTLIL